MSLDTVELIVSIEDHFEIRIPDPVAEKLNTVQDIVDCVYTMIKDRPENGILDSGHIAKVVIELISDKSGIPVDQIKLEHSITNDLGMD
ncbi:MAG: phosphopantetheine-binding protein [Cyclobacteriaceae bacterium]|jgi:acyl carrier protein|nr:phosphopantetheine-binding protein [Flammeovirgaceae bacterium]